MQFQRLAKSLVVLLLTLPVFGCTEERALALKTAAESFGNKASAAIDTVVELSVRASLGKQATEEVSIDRAKQALLLTQKNRPDQLNAVITESFKWLQEREALRRTAYADYDKLKAAYASYAAAYKRLPEGSLIAAKDIACSAALGGRLTKYMADAGKALSAAPVALIWETAEGRAALAAGAARANTINQEKPIDEPVRAYVALLKEQDRINAEAVAKLADAAEAGAHTLDLIEKYNDISIADLLKGLRRVLVVGDSSLGFSSKAQIDRLDNVITKLNRKPALTGVLALPLNQTPIECN